MSSRATKLLNMSETELTSLLPGCCRMGFASIAEYRGAEQVKLKEFLPGVRTVIVLAHHVEDALEWTWLRFPTERNGVTCPADLHSKSNAERVANRLRSGGFQAVILPYPGKCGAMFKTLALPTRLGELGKHFLFMNSEWGPWIHLRVVLTDVQVSHRKPEILPACTQCGRCLAVCPGGAIREDSFDGLVCRDSMRERRKLVCDGSFDFECEVCLRACPVGIQPREIVVRFKEQTPHDR